MKRSAWKQVLSTVAALLVLPASVAAITIAGGSAHAAERPVAREKNPPGDIPDSQVFVLFRSALGFSLKVPEGWARTDRADGARFSDKYNTIDMSVSSASAAPTAASVRTREAADLVHSGRAVKIEAVKSVKLRSGPAILIAYSSNSEPNPVTNKQLRLENHRYLVYRDGKLAAIDLSAPLGADNADQWKLISDSFRWH